MQFNQFLGQGEAQSGPRDAPGRRRVETGKLLEQARQVVPPDPDPRVDDGDFYEIARV
ncbi:MAG: hypothetical protein M5R38_08415 [Candidatus Methylomirabilis sp.]|nr:hypothetical protein [Candidatus Methylomirabilis sp.]